MSKISHSGAARVSLFHTFELVRHSYALLPKNIALSLGPNTVESIYFKATVCDVHAAWVVQGPG